ncbi:myotubularin-related protein 3-like isoform X1 [Homalodisca vitripennis]|uniref:myotubularin-related protein 3-like isoform X1 n=1 Tax=Homalodisca vitripennis TaxID=197043 RepID=UPI001EEB20C1|nr:myotubularin-related protein 3-like isoform X1 [Homalodisca vitripennis]
MAEEGEGQSLQLIRPCELYPKTATVMEEEGLVVPFNPLCGEFVAYVGRTATGVMALSNYRIYHQVTKLSNTFYNIPLGLVEQVEVKDLFLQISCKDATICRFLCTSNENCTEWVRRITKATSPTKNVEDIFAFSLYAWAHEEGNEETLCRLNDSNPIDVFNSEVERLQFDVSEGGPWRISAANREYELCKSYPRLLLVPADITDEKLDAASKFRSSRRVPAIVWRHKGNGAVIARCSQPEVGLLGWRSSDDEELSNSILMACSNPTNPDNDKKLLIMDARSYATAWVNRARGGGCEYPEYYPKCEIQFMNLANIHAIRKSFCSLRSICWPSVDQPNWYSLLEGTRWLQNMAGLIHAAITLANAVENDGRPVLVHCSDGWDRTPQIVSLAQLLLDPYYRTIEGFRVLVEREWLEFGHKFADRCGLREDINERCPVFLQWLDCIHNIIKQYPCAFELNSNYLIKLAQHTYSNMFGMFLCNNSRERAERNIANRTFSVWNILQAPQFVNHLYYPQEQVLWPSCNIRDLELWRELYLGRSTGLDNPPVPQPVIFPANVQDTNANVEAEFTNGEDLNGNGEEQNNHLEESDVGKHADSKLDEDLENQDQIDEILSTELNQAFSTVTSPDEGTDEATHDQAGASVESSTETLLPTNNSPDIPLSLATDNDGAAAVPVSALALVPVPARALALIPAPALALVPAPTRQQDAGCSRQVSTLLDPVDGLTSPKDPVQQRLTMMVQEHKARELALERELHATRLALLQQVCHQCNNTGAQERPDDDGSVCSTEVSWEAVEEQEVLPTLWVPDHAVSHCMGCHNQFWLGRRKHHCRSCGKVFCADCSPNTLPLPEEQLYEPVRVCAECYKGPSKEPEPNVTTCKQAVKQEADATTCKQAAGNSLLSPASAHTHA